MSHVVAAILLFVVLGSGSVNCWIINNVKASKLSELLKLDSENELTSEEVSELRLTLIYPGTKWCGAGNNAANYSDLGTKRETDICCRDHDNCPDIIEAGETRHNLTNEAFYTRLSCECDEKFHQCLLQADSLTANNIGKIYFNALGTECFRLEYPVVRCIRRGGWLNRKCLEYSYDTNANKIYQWFDVDNY